jgi:hypothetical protein
LFWAASFCGIVAGFEFDGHSSKFSAIFVPQGHPGTTFAYEIERATGKKEG